LRDLAGIVSGYSNLEYNLEAGARGERYSHFEKLLLQTDRGRGCDGGQQQCCGCYADLKFQWQRAEKL